ncbi:MAG: hypothetical protein HYZ53_04785 [Planctomycetes bacterium]|nr:hypothetical protein [Planctomycetota bacterium]
MLKTPLPEDSEDAEMKEIYALFGLAYYLSECIHTGLANTYCLMGFESKCDITRPRIEERQKRAFDSTLGQLVREMSGSMPEALRQELDRAVEVRNFLAHGFWFEKIHLVLTQIGRSELRRELQHAVTMFQQVDGEIDRFGRTVCEQLGLPSPEEFRKLGAEQGALDGPPEPLPDRRIPKGNITVVSAWEVALADSVRALVLEAEDGSLWQLCDVGLGWSTHVRTESGGWTVCSPVQRFLPAAVPVRPRTSGPWNFDLPLGVRAVLWVSKAPSESKYRWGVRAALR